MSEAPPIVATLIERFAENRDSYKSPGYNETQLRREFLDPLFEALGWDVANKQGHAEAYKDVIHEDAIKIGGTTKAPDYCFRIGGTRKFFLEAKKPTVNLKDEISPAYQLRRYAWSAKLPLSVLTDFEEFVVYDCRIRPNPTDKPSAGRILYLTYQEYLSKWDQIASVFTKEAVLKGSFDKYAVTDRRRGTATVDAEFLKEIENWRDALAKNLAARNPLLSVGELNFAVQRTIDRLVFLRICEDRGIEPPEQLKLMLRGRNVYDRLLTVYNQADDRYNSGLFHFHREKGRAESPDHVTPQLKIDDAILKEIISRMYYPQSPYEFSVFPMEILGQVYEQFLGKVIRLTARHQAKIEEKPEVKKAGGVYYTPAYIVEYLVKHTVKVLCEDKTPAQVGRLRILDPACGSGSFLLGAYSYLLDWHLKWYISDGPEQHRKELFKTIEGGWRLKTAEKRRILLNNIYGVDIDSQAAEVTKLSLLLKVLEGENKESLQELLFGRVRALPDLGQNIKCGNSLIGPDYFAAQAMPDEGEMRRVNPFDWKAEFPGILRTGGFDVVIGNPPYGFHQIHNETAKKYFKTHYSACHGSFEHYFMFYEASLRLLKNHGMHGFIVPVTWLTIPSARSLRKLILEKYAIQEIVWLPKLVFENAQVNTLISIITRDEPNKIHVKIYDCLGFRSSPRKEFTLDQARVLATDCVIGIFEDESDTRLLSKLHTGTVPLDTLAKPCSGYNPYEIGKGQRPEGGPHDKGTVEARPYHSSCQKGRQWKMEIVGRDLGRYQLNLSGTRWVKYGPWLAAARDPENFKGKRILVQEITGGKDRRIIATYYDGELYHSRDVIPVKCDSLTLSPLYLLGIINSRLITWYHHKKSPKAQKALFPKVLVSDIAKFPIPPIDLSNAIGKTKHDHIVSLVLRMLELHERWKGSLHPEEKTRLQRQIDLTDRQIDSLVYDLYGLTEEEINIVEAGLGSVLTPTLEDAPMA